MTNADNHDPIEIFLIDHDVGLVGVNSNRRVDFISQPGKRGRFGQALENGLELFKVTIRLRGTEQLMALDVDGDQILISLSRPAD